MRGVYKSVDRVKPTRNERAGRISPKTYPWYLSLASKMAPLKVQISQGASFDGPQYFAMAKFMVSISKILSMLLPCKARSIRMENARLNGIKWVESGLEVPATRA